MPTSDKIYADLYVLNDKGDICITSTLKSKDGMYTEYKGTEQGGRVANDKFTHFWFGNDADIDATLGTDSSRYAIRYGKLYGYSGAEKPFAPHRAGKAARGARGGFA
jgi:hypothetical protein